MCAIRWQRQFWNRANFLWPNRARMGREIWEHAPEILRLRDYSRIKSIHADPSMFQYMSQQSQRPGYALERARSYAELYREAGIQKALVLRGDRSDISFAARLHLHWDDLEHRELTVKIVSHPEPSTKSFGRRVNERLSELHNVDPTFAAMQYPWIVQEEQQEDYEPEYYTRNARRLVRQLEQRFRRGLRW